MTKCSVIFACLDPDRFYKVTITSRQLHDVKAALNWISATPWDVEARIPLFVTNLKSRKDESALFLITSTRTTIVFKTWEVEDLLEYPDDVLKLPAVYLTRRFKLMRENASLSLTSLEDKLIGDFEAKNTEIDEN